MDKILEWLTKYSPPIVGLLAFGAALIFIFEKVTENVISYHFEQYKKEIDLRLQRRSNFEERVLLDRYTLVHDIQLKIEGVMTDLNRVKDGIKVEGLFRGGNELVRLTEVYEALDNNKYLLTERLYNVLFQEAEVARKFANAKQGNASDALRIEYTNLRESFNQAMNEAFAIYKIQ
jgi:hypothetical protein